MAFWRDEPIRNPVQFAADFPAATQEQWRKLVDAVLKGAPFERLVSSTYDGLAIEPLAARRSDAQPMAARPGASPWEILARIDHPDPALADEIALRELKNGATGLALVFSGSRGDPALACRQLKPRSNACSKASTSMQASPSKLIYLQWP